MDGARNVLAFAGSLAMDERGKDRDIHLITRDIIGVPQLRGDRRQIVMARRIGIVAATHHDPTQCQMDKV